MTEEEDAILPVPDPLPPEIITEDDKSDHGGDNTSEANQAQKHRDFVAKHNEDQDAALKFDSSFSVHASTESEVSNTVCQEVKCNGFPEAEQEAETVADTVTDQAVYVVSNDPTNEKGEELSSSSALDDVIERKDDNLPGGIDSNMGAGQDTVVKQDIVEDQDAVINQDDKEDQDTVNEDENSKHGLDEVEGDISHEGHISSAAETKVEAVNSESSLLSGSVSKQDDTFSVDKSHDQTDVAEDLPSVDLVKNTGKEELPENRKDEENEAIKDTELPTKVDINILNALYFPTKLVNGYVSISRDYDIPSLTLSLICEGNQSITWVTNASAKNSEDEINESSEKIVETQSFFTDYVDLIHEECSDHDNLKFAFSYQFPPNLPSSFSYFQNDETDLYAVIEYSFILLDIKENQIIAKKTINMYEAPPYHYLTKSKKDSIKIFYLSCINRGTLTLKAELDKGCYFLGETAQIRCCLENDASEKISEIGVYLCRYLHFKDTKFNQFNVRHILNRQKFLELDEKWSGKSHGTVLPFEIKEVATQSVSSSQFVNCYFVIRVAIKSKSGHELFVDLDVVLYTSNQSMSDIKGNGYDSEMKLSPSFEHNSESSSSSSSSDESSNDKVAQKINDSDLSRKSSLAASVENPVENKNLLNLQNDDSNAVKDKDLSNQCVENQHNAKNDGQIKQEGYLDVDLPRFPEDYLPTSGDESDDFSMQDVIVQL